MFITVDMIDSDKSHFTGTGRLVRFECTSNTRDSNSLQALLNSTKYSSTKLNKHVIKWMTWDWRRIEGRHTQLLIATTRETWKRHHDKAHGYITYVYVIRRFLLWLIFIPMIHASTYVLNMYNYQLFCSFYSFSDPSPSPCTKNHLFDFESSNEKSYFQSATSDTLTLSTDQKTVKQGQKSLKWQATGASTLKLKSASTFIIPNNWLLRGGIKVWLYKEEL